VEPEDRKTVLIRPKESLISTYQGRSPGEPVNGWSGERQSEMIETGSGGNILDKALPIVDLIMGRDGRVADLNQVK